MRQRDVQFAGNVFIAAASTKSDGVAEALQTYLDSVYTDNKQHMEEHDKAMERELELMLQVDWKTALSIPEGARSHAEFNLEEGQTIEDII